MSPQPCVRIRASGPVTTRDHVWGKLFLMDPVLYPIYRALFPCILCALTLFSGHARGATPFTREVAADPPGQRVIWAKPLAAGAINALFIAPRFSLGDLKELEARLDLRYETAPLWDAFNLGYDPASLEHPPEHGSRDETLARLDALLNDRWDVIVLANIDTGVLPEPILSRILDHVATGTGLLSAHLRDAADSRFMTVLQVLPPEEEAPSLAAGIGECAFPGTASLENIGTVLHHEKGRVVALAYPGDPPENHCLIQVPADPIDLDAAYEDNAYALVIRALCIASGHLSKTRILSVQDVSPSGPDTLEIPPDFYPEFVQAMRDSVVSQPSRPFQLLLEHPADQRYTVEAQLRRVDSRTQVIYRDKTPLERGAVSHLFEIPAGPGTYMLDAWLYTRSGVADWFTAGVTIPGWPEFYDLHLEKTWLMPNDTLEITLQVRPVVSSERQGAIYVRAQDGFERTVADTIQAVSFEGGRVTLRLHFSDLLSPLVKVEVFAVDSAPRPFSEWELHCAFREVRYLSVRQPRTPANLELVALSGELREYGASHFLEVLAGAGVTALHAPAGEATIIAAAQGRLPLLPELMRVTADRARDGIYREPCLNDPDYRQRVQMQLHDSTLKHWAGTLAGYSLGNRNYLGASEENLCQCGFCLGVLQEHLQANYPDIASLNKAWNTDFGDWDFIAVPPAMGPGNEASPAPWIDFRSFMDDQFATFHGWARVQVAAADSEALIGARFTTDTNAYHGCHWPDLFQALDFAAGDYSPLFLEKLRSYGKRNSWSGVALPDAGYLEDTRLLSWLPWRLALYQINALWIDTLWGGATHAPPNAWLQADNGLSPAFEILTKTVREIRDTVGPLLFAAETSVPKIAVYDSHYSQRLCDINKEYSVTLKESQEAAAQLLQCAGYAFRFVGKPQMAALNPSNSPVLILPMCRSLDTDERAALRAFAEGGGALIADVAPGVFDAHGCRVAESGLDDLFGICTTDSTQITQAALTSVEAAQASAGDAGQAMVDAALSTRDGIALAKAGETPAWIVNRTGKSHTLLLNHPFRPVRRQEGREGIPSEKEALATFLRDLPEMSGQAVLSSESFLGSLCRFRFGEAHIFAIQADVDASKQKLRLPLNSKDTAYNALTGESIRRPHRHKFILPPAGLEIICCLPYTLKELKLESSKIAYVGQQLAIRIQAKAEKNEVGKHLFLVDLLPANRPALSWYRRIISAERGVAELYLPLAKNEIPGWYTLRVRDTLTGTETTTPLKIASPTD